MPTPFLRLTNPRYPATAIGLEKGRASIVHLERGRGNACNLRRAATVSLPDSLLCPSFNEQNLSDKSEFIAALRELATSAGLLSQRKWSATLPEATTRTLILTLETQAGSHAELEEVLRWKMERGFAMSLDDLSISRERLAKDSQGRERYIVVAVRAAVLEEYESVISSLGWRAGLILPRHMGEAEWLTRNGFSADSLLLSSSAENFTAVVFREGQPLIIRTVSCEPEEREDELYRLLLFYRDRRIADVEQPSQLLTGLLVLGDGFSKNRAREIVNETLGSDLRTIEAEDVGLQIPVGDLSFDAIAAPAGLATLAWR